MVLRGGLVSARGATRGAAHARQVDVPARDEEHATTGHASDRLTPPACGRCDPGDGRPPVSPQATGAGCPSIAARMRATDSSSGVTEVSMTRSGRAGAS